MRGRRARDWLIRHGTFPLLAFGPGALALALVTPGAGGPRATELAGCALLVVAAYGLLAWLERVLPHREDWNRPKNDVGADWAYFLVIGPLSAVGSAFLAARLVGVAHGAVPSTMQLAVWPTGWHPAAQLFLACLVAELGHYAMHRLGHEVPLVWRLHAVHHSARRLYWLNATRFHPLDLFLVAFFQVLPLHLLGIPTALYLAYAVASSCYGQLQHCNVDVDTRIWSALFATPELHRWHHSQRADEGNTNYGAILIVWDRVFGTRFWPGKPITEPVGIGGMPSFPDGLVGQMLAPVRWAELEEPRDARS